MQTDKPDYSPGEYALISGSGFAVGETVELRVVRTEVLRAGFKECWQKGLYAAIVETAQRLPEAVVQEDPALLMYYDNALMRTEG